jgi:hypothetical protein
MYSLDTGSQTTSPPDSHATRDSPHDSNANSPASISLPEKFGSVEDPIDITPLLPTITLTVQHQSPGIHHLFTSTTHDIHETSEPMNDHIRSAVTTSAVVVPIQTQEEHVYRSETQANQTPSISPLLQDPAVSDPHSIEAPPETPTRNFASTDYSSRHLSSPSPIFSPVHSSGPSVLLPPPPAPTGGESIYRTIMNRLTALEANHSLYTRYIEEQTVGVRDVLKRLGEDVGRVEAIVGRSVQIPALRCQEYKFPD